MPGLVLDDISVSFAGLAAPVLEIARLAIAPGETVAVTGPSGSGKSTLINVVTGLERPNRGRVMWAGEDLARRSEAARDAWRAANVGLVMQDFHLFPGLSAVENVLLPARFRRLSVDASMKARALDLLAHVGIARPAQSVETLSRGEMQRVAVARALLKRPGIIVADEPTASLDAEAGAVVGELLTELSRKEGATLVAVTHDDRLVARLDRQVRLKAGRIVADGPVMREGATGEGGSPSMAFASSDVGSGA